MPATAREKSLVRSIIKKTSGASTKFAKTKDKDAFKTN